MSIVDLVDSVVRPTIPFEMMPPRSPDAAPKFWATAREFGAGVRSFLALRGDPPRDQPDWKPPGDGVHSSDELIHLLPKVEAQCCSDHPALALRGGARPLTVAALS